MQAKAEYSENLGKLTAKLTATLQEKRYLIKKGAKKVAKDCSVEDTLKTAELYLIKDEENQRLEEQVLCVHNAFINVL